MGIDFTIEEKAGPKIPPMRTWEAVSAYEYSYLQRLQRAVCTKKNASSLTVPKKLSAMDPRTLCFVEGRASNCLFLEVCDGTNISIFLFMRELAKTTVCCICVGFQDQYDMLAM